jgi:hypothetical protein
MRIKKVWSLESENLSIGVKEMGVRRKERPARDPDGLQDKQHIC